MEHACDNRHYVSRIDKVIEVPIDYKGMVYLGSLLLLYPRQRS